MFNQYVTKHETVVTPITQVIEKSVSPDKVAEIYDQALTQARQDILKKYIVKTNFVEFLFVERTSKTNIMGVEYAACINLNGQDIEFSMDHAYNGDDGPQEIAKKFIKLFSEHIASKFVFENSAALLPSNSHGC